MYERPGSASRKGALPWAPPTAITAKVPQWLEIQTEVLKGVRTELGAARQGVDTEVTQRCCKAYGHSCKGSGGPPTRGQLPALAAGTGVVASRPACSSVAHNLLGSANEGPRKRCGCYYCWHRCPCCCCWPWGAAAARGAGSAAVQPGRLDKGCLARAGTAGSAPRGYPCIAVG